MNTLFRFCRGTEVKILQGLLNLNGMNIAQDGIFGKDTQAAVKVFQRKTGLTTDGIVGKQTWQALGVAPWSNKNICTLRVPFKNAEKIDVLLKNGQSYSVAEFSKLGYTVVVNGAMFDTKTRRDIADMVINGRLINGGNYSCKGLAFKGATVKQSTTEESMNAGASFIGGAPTLILNGFDEVDMKGLSMPFYTAYAKRTCIGADSKAFYIMLSLKKLPLSAMMQEGLFLKLVSLINLDGGGSQSLFIGRSTVIPTDGRGIPSAIGIKLK